MAVIDSHISWCTSTWNPTTGCTKVSDGCKHCYAEALTHRLWGGGFDNVKTHPDRLGQTKKFRPVRGEDGQMQPHLVFVNSMSDLMHDDIPETFRHDVFDRIEATPDAIFQVLTKRPAQLKKFVQNRYGNTGVPRHLWLGVSCEDNQVAGRLNILRRIKDRVGDFTAFVSVEPLIGPCDQMDFTGLDWILIGGESRQLGKARPMLIKWPMVARDLARIAGSAIWFKQFGQWQNNPLFKNAPPGPLMERVEWVIQNGERCARIETDPKTGKRRLSRDSEKGGATLDGEVLHEFPPAFYAMKAEMRDLAA